MLDALELYTAWLEAQETIDEIEEEVMRLFRGNNAENLQTDTDETEDGRGDSTASPY
jgi:hypothetical protein